MAGAGRHRRYAASCATASAFGFAKSAWPFGLAEMMWIAAPLRRWYLLAHPPLQ